MTAGRKPHPTALKIIRGNPGNRPLNTNEPDVPPAVPPPPRHLSADAIEEWERVTKGLYAAGILTDIDMGALAAYCQAYGRWAQAERAINTMAANDPVSKGLLMRSAKGNPMTNPLLGIANKSMSDMVRYAAEFGMTPSARSRIRVTDAVAESANPFVQLKVS